MPDLAATLSSSYGPHARQVVDVFIPRGAEAQALVVCLPSGWWEAGSPRELRPLALLLAEQGLPVALLGTRLLNDGAVHGGELLEDVLSGIRRALEDACLLGHDGRTFSLLGSGSGSLLALLAGRALANEPTLRLRAIAAVGVTPSLERDSVLPNHHHACERFAGADKASRSPAGLPLGGLPPLMLLHGDNDLDVSAKQALKLHQAVQAAGGVSEVHILSGAGHHLLETPHDKHGTAALAHLMPFLREQGAPLV